MDCALSFYVQILLDISYRCSRLAGKLEWENGVIVKIREELGVSCHSRNNNEYQSSKEEFNA